MITADSIQHLSDLFMATSQRLVFLKFYTPECGPCRVVGMTLNYVERDFGDSIRFIAIDTNNEELAKHYGVQSIPTMVVLKDGVEVERLHGARYRYADFETILNKHLASL